MLQVVSISNQIISLNQVHDQFNLRRSGSDQFFGEWLHDLPQITDAERERLDQIKSKYLYQSSEGPLPEETVKVVLSPLLDLAGFYESPFRFKTEMPVEIELEGENNEILRGRIDALVIQQQLWIVVVEAKRTSINPEVGIPQALAYMMARPQADHPLFGVVTNGNSFVFIKTFQQEYDYSDLFWLPSR